MVRRQRILIRSRVQKSEIQALASVAVIVGKDNGTPLSSINIIGVTAGTREPDFYCLRVGLIRAWHHMPFLMYGPSVEEIIHKTSVYDIPFLRSSALWRHVFHINDLVHGNLRGSNHIPPPLAAQIGMRHSSLVRFGF